MKIHAVIPVKALGEAKRRLNPLLTPEGRRQLTFHMLNDVISALREAQPVAEIVVVSADPHVLSHAERLGCRPMREQSSRGVNSAVALAVQSLQRLGVESVLVVPADIPMITPGDVEGLARLAAAPGTMVLTPSMRLDGTNALLLNPARNIQTRYEADSFRSHLRLAGAWGFRPKVYLSPRIMLDIDVPEDLELFLKLKAGVDTETYRFASGLLRR